MPEPTYYIAGLFRQANDTLARSYLKISTGAGGVQAISAGVNSTSSGTVVFSNANNVSFGMNGAGVVTAIANTVGGGALTNILFSAGTYSTYRSDITFDNSNGITFGQDTAGVITATVRTDYQSSGAYLTTAALSQDSSKYAGTGFTTATTAGTNIVGTLNTAGLSMGIPAYLTTASAGGITAINLSAGTTSSNISAFTFSNGSGVTFGFDGSNVTASVQTNYLTTAMASDRGTDFVQATAGFHGTNASGTIASSGISVSVAPTAVNINISAGTTSSNVSAVTFSNANNVSFGYDGSNVTVTVASTQGSIKISAGLSSSNVSAVTFANSNGVSFGYDGTVITATVATNYLTTAQPVGNYAGTNTSVVTTGGTDLSFAVNTSGVTIAYPKWITSATAGGVALSNSQTLFSTGTVNLLEGGGAITIASSAGGQSFKFSVPQTTMLAGVSGIGLSSSGSTISILASLAGTNTSTASTAGANLTMSANTNGITLGVPAFLTTAAPSSSMASYWQNLDQLNNTTTTMVQSNSFYVFPISIPYAVSFSYVRFLASINFTSTSIATSAVNNVTGASTAFSETVQWNALFYTAGAGANSRSLQELCSSSAGLTWAASVSQASTSNATNQSFTQRITFPNEGAITANTSTQYSVSATNGPISTTQWSNLSAQRFLDIPFATSLSAGAYWLAFNRISGTVGGKNMDCNATIYGVSNTNMTWANMNSASNVSNPGPFIGLGLWTQVAAGTSSSIGLANISEQSSYMMPFVQLIRQA